MSEKFQVHEFGNSFTIPASRSKEVESAALEQARYDFNRTFDTLQYIRDFEWVKPAEIKKGPRVDILDRFRSVGWYAMGGSVGYDKLKEHFRCHQRHVPYKITTGFIIQIIKEYVRQKTRRNLYG